MKVVDWIHEDEVGERECSIGGMGGWFNGSAGIGEDRHWRSGDRWQDYLDNLPEDVHPYCEALRAEILAKRIRRGGFWHQRDGDGVPVFEDGTVAQFSMRAWGDLLAAVWSQEENKDYCYVNFAWYSDEEKQ